MQWESKSLEPCLIATKWQEMIPMWSHSSNAFSVSVSNVFSFRARRKLNGTCSTRSELGCPVVMVWAFLFLFGAGLLPIDISNRFMQVESGCDHFQHRSDMGISTARARRNKSQTTDRRYQRQQTLWHFVPFSMDLMNRELVPTTDDWNSSNWTCFRAVNNTRINRALSKGPRKNTFSNRLSYLSMIGRSNSYMLFWWEKEISTTRCSKVIHSVL